MLGLPAHAAEGDLRLADLISPDYGRLEVYLNGTWGSVCDDRFGSPDAVVACRQMGYSSAGRWHRSSLRGTAGTGPIHLDDLACVGDETRLVNCPRADVHDCSHIEDVQLLCLNDSVTVTASDGQVREGADAEFLLKRIFNDRALTVQVKVTETGDAIDGDAPTTLRFAGNETKATLAVPTVDDSVEEDDSTLTVSVVDGDGYRGGRASSASLRVLDDDGPTTSLTLTASPRLVSEGAGSTTVTVTATLDGPALAAAASVTVSVASATDDAEAVDVAAVEDFAISIAAGSESGSGTFVLTPENDARDEVRETLSVSGTANVGGTTLSVNSTSIAVVDDDDRPRMTILGSPCLEGGACGYVAKLDRASGRTVKVSWKTDNEEMAPWGPPAYRLAERGADYTHAGGVLTFAPGETQKTFQVTAVQDAVHEPPEAVVVTLTDPLHAEFEGRAGGRYCIWSGCDEDACCDCSVIADDDPLPVLSIGDATAVEGAGAELVFPVTFSGATEKRAWVRARTVDVSAVTGEDYYGGSVWLQYRPPTPAVLHGSVTVNVIDDSLSEPTETFRVRLTDVVGATISDGEATGTIVDDELPMLSIGDARGVEGFSAVFTVTVDGYVGEPISVDCLTGDGTAVAGSDYTRTACALIFDTRTAATVPVSLWNDGVDEPEETFTLRLSNVRNATIEDGVGQGVIVDADDPPVFSVASATGAEGETVAFAVTLDGASALSTTVDYASADGSALADRDYTAVSGTLTFAPGASVATVDVDLLDDATDEPTETFRLGLSSATNASIATADAEGTILDNDGAPQVSVGGVAGVEGERLEFVVRITGSTSQAVTVAYATRDWSAFAGEDYTRARGTLTINPGASTAGVFVQSVDDAVYEGDEQFRFDLSSPQNAELAVATATGTIRDNDAAPQLSIRGASAAEGEVLRFDVSVTGTRTQPVRVAYATRDGTAVAGSDYEASSGTLTIAPTESGRTVAVRLLDDAVHEADEHFRLELSAPENAELAAAAATGTIRDNDPAATQVVLSASPARVTEDAGRTPVTVTATLDGGAASATTVEVSVAGSGDADAVDFEAVPDFAIEIGAGASTGRRVFTLVPEDDDVDEADEILTVSGASRLPVSPATVVLADDDVRPVKTFRVLLFESAGNPHRQGFLRVINHSPAAGVATIEATDDGGVRRDPVTLLLERGEAAHFNSDDLEGGNAAKGLSGGVGTPSRGEWRLLVSSDLDIEVLAYSRTKHELGRAGTGMGFVTSMHEVAPVVDGEHRISFFNPGRNVNQVSWLRVVNTGEGEAEATVRGTDDAGVASGEARLRLAAGTALTLSAAQLESGSGVGIEEGALGTGTGKWRLTVGASGPLAVKSLLASVGKLTNLSTTLQAGGTDGRTHRVPLFPSMAQSGWEGLLRVVNDSPEAGEVRIEATDDTGYTVEPVTLAIAANRAVHLTSGDLELGNAAKGLSGSTGPAASGSWRLELTSALDIRVASLVRADDGFLTAMNAVAPVVEGTHRVAFFNPAENPNQVSRLRLINDGGSEAAVTVTGVDDTGRSPGSAVELRVAAGTVLEVSAVALETGEGEGVVGGALGDGTGKWRLRIGSDAPLRVVSLLESPTGHLSNLSGRLRSEAAQP